MQEEILSMARAVSQAPQFNDAAGHPTTTCKTSALTGDGHAVSSNTR